MSRAREQGVAYCPILLVVDDDESTRECMKCLLEVHGYQVVTAADGYEALGLLHSGTDPALIVLDLMMPGMDGYQFRQRQVEEPQLATIPVVLCSCCDDLSEDAARMGAEAYLRKPIDVDCLLDVIAAHCGTAASSEN